MDKVIAALTFLNIVLIIAHIYIDVDSRKAIAKWRKNMIDGHKIAVITDVPSGATVPNGYPGGECTAPEEPGEYTLFEEVWLNTNTHKSWVWEKGHYPAILEYKDLR